MAANNLGTAYIKIAPQMQGIQSSISNAIKGATKSGSSVSTAAIAVGNVISKGISVALNAVTSSVDAAIRRTDILNNFPKVMSNMGISAEESQKSISKLVEKLDGLPTSLQDGAAAVQRFTSRNNDIQKSTQIFLVLNNALLAGGMSTEQQATALEQLSQAYAKGKPDMMEWRSMQQAMPAQLNQISKKMLGNKDALEAYMKKAQDYADKNPMSSIGKEMVEQLDAVKKGTGDMTTALGTAMRAGVISMDEFMNTIIELNENGSDGFKSFEEQARNSTDGIGTAMTNVRNRIAAALQKIINAFGSKDIAEAINKFSSNFGKMADWIVENIVPVIKQKVIPALKTFLGIIKNVFEFIGQNKWAQDILMGLAAGLIGFKVVQTVFPIFSKVGGLLGTVASKLGLFKGTKALGSGVGNTVAAVLKPLGKTDVVKGAASVALVAGAVYLFAEGIAKVSKEYIDWGKVVLLEVNMAVITAIIAAIGSLAGTGAIIGGVASAVIAGGLWVFANALADLTPKLDRIKWDSIYALTGHIALISAILASIVALELIGAVGAVADAVIGGGLLIAAAGLATASQYADKVDVAKITKLSLAVAEVATVLGILIGFEIFGAIGAICNAVISGGLLVAAIALQETSKHAQGLDGKTFQSFTDCHGQISSALAIASTWSWAGAIGAIFNDAISGGVLVASLALEEASKHAKKIKEDDYKRLSNVFREISSWETGGILAAFQKMVASGELTAVAWNVKNTLDAFAQMGEAPDEEKINKLKNAIENLSRIEVHGSGLFESKGGAAQELEWIMSNIVSINHKMTEIVPVDMATMASFINALRLFSFIDQGTVDGILRLDGIHDSLGNINWIKYILGDVPADLPTRAGYIVQALNTLAGFDARNISIESIASAVAGLLNAIKSAIVGGYQVMIEQGKQLAYRVRDGIMSSINALAEAGKALQSAFWAGLQSKMQDEYWQGRALAEEVKNGINSIVNGKDIKQSGKNAGLGLISGLESTYFTAYSAGRRMAAALIQGVQDRGREGSPWKTTFQSGVFAGQGLAEGLLAAKDDVVDAAIAIADATQDALGLDNRGFSAGLANTHLMPQTALTGSQNGSQGQVIQYNDFTVDSELDVKEISKRLGWQVATAL